MANKFSMFIIRFFGKYESKTLRGPKGRGLAGRGLAGRGLAGRGLAGRGLAGRGLAGRGPAGGSCAPRPNAIDATGKLK